MTKYSNTPTRNDFISAARKYLKTPFAHQGRDRRGLDCLGLLVCVARDLKIPVVDNLRYSKSPDHDTMSAGLMTHFDSVPRVPLVPGNVLWIKWARNGLPMHLAIISWDGAIIHADGSRSVKKVTECTMPGDFTENIVRCLRWKVWAK